MPDIRNTRRYYQSIIELELDIASHKILIAELLPVNELRAIEGYLDELWLEAFRAGEDSVEV